MAVPALPGRRLRRARPRDRAHGLQVHTARHFQRNAPGRATHGFTARVGIDPVPVQAFELVFEPDFFRGEQAQARVMELELLAARGEPGVRSKRWAGRSDGI